MPIARAQTHAIPLPRLPLGTIEPLNFGLPVDRAKVDALWAQARKTGKLPADETIEGEQVRRRAELHEIMHANHRTLEQQLPIARIYAPRKRS